MPQIDIKTTFHRFRLKLKIVSFAEKIIKCKKERKYKCATIILIKYNDQ